MESSYVELNKKLNELITDFGKENAGITKGFMQMHKTMEKETALSPKMKELIALAIGVASRCDGCIAFHTKLALEHGATRDEIIEAIGVSVFMGGGPALVYASLALKALNDFEEK